MLRVGPGPRDPSVGVSGHKASPALTDQVPPGAQPRSIANYWPLHF